MDYLLSIEEAREHLNKKRAELRKKELEHRKREFDKLPEKRRKVLEMFGCSPYQDGEQIRRECGTLEIK